MGNRAYPVVIKGKGKVNGVTFEASGKGSGNAASGKWDFSVMFSKVPADVDPFANLLGILILPTVVFGKVHGDAENLLTVAGGDLEFTQRLRGDDVHVDAVGTFRRTGTEFVWNSEAEGKIGIPRVASIEPFDAVMLPQGHGKFTETFAFPFVCESGRVLVQAVRNFTFSPRAELRDIQFRRIAIVSSVEGRTVSVKTTSHIRTIDGAFRVT